LAAFLTLAELAARTLRQRKQEGEQGSTIRTRMRAVRVSGPQAYLTIVATAQRWVFCFGSAPLYKPTDQESWTYQPDDDGYLTIDLSAFRPDGEPSFFGYVPGTGALEEVRVEVFIPGEFHIAMPAGAMG
jgi:hypothetical protein